MRKELSLKDEKLIEAQIEESNKLFQQVNNYINDNLFLPKNYSEALLNLKRVSYYLDSNNIENDIDLLMDLVTENSIIIESLLLINLDKNYENKTINLLIESYCIINNIKINTNINTKVGEIEEDMYVEDITKQYLYEIGKIPLLSNKEEKELLERVKLGDQIAQNKLINSNLRLVVWIAKKYQNRGVELIDLISEGNFGLITAIGKYDLDKGNRLSTYACHWIRQSVERYFATRKRNIRIPVHVHEKVLKFSKIKGQLELKLNREPTLEEIAKYLNISIEEAKKLEYYQYDTVSFNNLITTSEDEDTELGDILLVNNETPEDIAIKQSLRDEMEAYFELCNLNEKEKNIIRLRFGFKNERQYSLEEVGAIYKVTRERIRQIEAKAIRKLRNPIKAQTISCYAESPQTVIDDLKELRKSTTIKRKVKK